jgi:hypothetical protein
MPKNPLEGPDKDRVFVASTLNAEEFARVAAIVERIGRRAVLVRSAPGATLPAAATHVVVPDEPRSSKALIALVTGRTVCSLQFLDDCADVGYWIDEESADSVWFCKPSWPLMNVPVLFNEAAFDDADPRDQVRSVLDAGRALVRDSTTFTPGGSGRRNRLSEDTVVVDSGESLLQYLRRFY